VARTCTLIVIVLDALKPVGHKRIIEVCHLFIWYVVADHCATKHELEGFGIRLNKEPPRINFKRKDRGGINFVSTVSLAPAVVYFLTCN
jgi:ribosome-interacting GTPase 1